MGNDKDVVGRYFMEHLEVASAELRLLKPFQTVLYSWGKAKAELAITEKTMIANKILNGTVSIFPLSIGKHMKPRMKTWQNNNPRKAMENMNNMGCFLKLLKLRTKIREPTAYQLDTRIEQAPNPNSRVTLGYKKDDLGVPKANLHWELTALDKRSIRKIYELLGQQMGNSGLGRIKLVEFL